MKTKIGILIIIGVGMLTFFNSLSNPFIFDDIAQIVNNPYVTQVSGIVGIVSGSAVGPASSAFSINLFYKPIFYALYYLLYNVFGPNPFPFHLFQLFIHIANALFLYLILSYFIKKNLSLLISIVFLVHPINTETVVYIANLQDALFEFFGLSAVYLVVKNAKNTFTKKQIVSLAFLLFFSILSKGTGLLFLPIIFCYSYLFSKRNLKVVSLVLVAILIISLGLNIITSTHAIGFAYPAAMQRTPLFGRLITIPAILAYYFSTFIFPINLAISQEWVVKMIDVTHFFKPLFFDMFFLSVLAGFGFYIFRKRKDLLKVYYFFSIWFVLGLLFHMQLYPLDGTVADRWFYFPIIGLFGILGVGINSLEENKLFTQYIRKYAVIILYLVMGIFIVMSIHRNSQWQSPYALVVSDMPFTQSNWIYDTYASILLQSDDAETAKIYVQKSLALDSQDPNALANLGQIYEGEKKFSKAKEVYWQVIHNSLPGEPEYRMYDRIAKILLLHNRNAKGAYAILNLALSKYPDDAFLKTDYAVAEYMLGNKVIALEKLNELYVQNPTASYPVLMNIMKSGQPMPSE